MDSQYESLKIVLIGEAGVGKTSIISQFIEKSFQEDIESSVGGSFSSKTLIVDDNQLLNLEIWDTAGQERYRSLTKMFYKEASSAVLVYDITRKDSFEQIKEFWINQVKEFGPSGLILVLCANKSDLVKEERVDEEEARNYAKEIGALFCSTSAKKSYGISDLFLQIAKKYSGKDNIRIQNKENDIPIDDIKYQNDRANKKGSVKITNANNKEKEKKKKCC